MYPIYFNSADKLQGVLHLTKWLNSHSIRENQPTERAEALTVQTFFFWKTQFTQFCSVWFSEIMIVNFAPGVYFSARSIWIERAIYVIHYSL